MRTLTAKPGMDVEHGPDAIDRAASIASIVASVAVRHHDGSMGAGVLSCYDAGRAGETALRIADTLGFLLTRIPLSSGIPDMIDDGTFEHCPNMEDVATTPDPLFVLVETEGHAQSARLVQRLVAMVAAKRPEGARTALLVTMRGEPDGVALAIGRALHMDPDDVTVRIF